MKANLSLTMIVGVFWAASALAQSQPTRGIAGQPAPAWGVTQWLNLPAGKTGLDLADYKGKVIYLYGFQSWCPGCHKHGFPTLKQIIAKHDNDPDVAIVAVQTAFEGFRSNDFDAARDIVKRYDLKIPVGQSGSATEPSLFMRRYRTGGTPWTIIVDGQGVVRFNDFHIEATEAVQLIDRLKTEAYPPPGNRKQNSTGTAGTDSGQVQPVTRTTDGGGAKAAYFWPQWRGPLGTGVAPHADPPVEWSETKNVRWKLALPGKGHSTPVIWGDRVFVTTALPYGEALKPKYSGEPGGHDELPITYRHKFIVIAVSRRDGKILWERTVHEEVPQAGGHRTASLASQSPVTDGQHLFAFFGSYGLYCLSLDGKSIWEKDLGQMHPLHGHGEGSSPALYEDTLIVNWDQEGPSFLVAFDKRTGQERWKIKREAASSWTTPIVIAHGGRAQVIVSGSRRVRGYDLSTGEVIWECGGLSTENVVASPVAGDGMVYVGSTYNKQSILAIRLDGAKGDITGTKQVAWHRAKGAPYVPTPLLYRDSLYVIQHFQGILTCLNSRTGEPVYDPVRLPGIYNVFASPVAAAGRVYVTSREGVTLVLKHGDGSEVLAQNHLDDSFSASAALAGNELFLRGEQYLYCIVEK